ncbi:ATP-NAD kinase [Euryarchaeota archaeon ex4484_178]|nr:MAG: ATP-NAD kinase [Euryarchaeota archaeon ex4484_178]
MLKIGFLINPIAGMGGRVALKGTDNVVDEARRRGAREIAVHRARKFLENLKKKIFFFTASGKMGEAVLEDTKRTCKEFLERDVDLIIFVGGDGTARDVIEVVGTSIPILGVPSGVKMYSSVFAVTPKKAAEIVEKFAKGEASLGEGEVLDIDEEAYRHNQLKIRLFGYAKIPVVEDLVQSSKSEYSGGEEEEDKESIAEFIIENLEKDTLYLLGAGTTVAKIADKLGVEKTLLGVDALYNGKIIGKDLGEREILKLLDKYPKAKVIITPIGAQGFIFGRGNQQFSEKVLNRIGKENIIVIATPRKIRDLKKLRIDLENGEKLKGYYKVLIGYGRYKIMRGE